VVGAGVAGLSCAARLARAGLPVAVFDKGRGPGGRISTRRAGELRFDHGAQYLTARDPRFRAEAARWAEAGALARWEGRVVRLARGAALVEEPGERFVGVPGMSAPARLMAEGLDLRLGVRVGRLAGGPGAWLLEDEAGAPLGAFGSVVVAVPAPQAAPLLAPSPALARAAASAAMAPCWSVMARFAAPLGLGFEGALVGAPERPQGEAPPEPLSWAARDDSKPGRPGGGGGNGDGAESWVLHASPAWSRAWLERSPEAVADALLGAFVEITGARPGPVLHLSAHRWRYARPVAAAEAPPLVDAARGLAACGDWCREGRVEAAWLSGLDLAEALLR
jgi:predicted NAD/FAD-dependent oxidoreductase